MVERNARSIGQCDLQRRLCGRLCCFGGLRLGALPGPFLPIKHIGARDLVMFAAHQRQLDLVLHVLDVKCAALTDPSGQRANDVAGEFFDGLVHPARSCRGVSFDGKKCLGHRH
jgi:hypothetical protein